MNIGGVLAQIVNADIEQTLRRRAAQKTLPRKSRHHVREDREDVDSHGCLLLVEKFEETIGNIDDKATLLVSSFKKAQRDQCPRVENKQIASRVVLHCLHNAAIGAVGLYDRRPDELMHPQRVGIVILQSFGRKYKTRNRFGPFSSEHTFEGHDPTMLMWT